MTNNTEISNSDRREFFRVTDHVFIDFSELSDDEKSRLVPIIKNPVHNDDNAIQQRLSSLQTNLNRLIDQINHTDRDIARALRLIDEKVSILAQAVHQQENSTTDREFVETNLSGGGMAFLSANTFAAKATIEIRVEFQSSGSVIHAIANVVGCDKIASAPEDKPYLLRLVFSHMSEIDRNTLVKHTLSRQALELRMQKESSLI